MPVWMHRQYWRTPREGEKADNTDGSAEPVVSAGAVDASTEALPEPAEPQTVVVKNARGQEVPPPTDLAQPELNRRGSARKAGFTAALTAAPLPSPVSALDLDDASPDKVRLIEAEIRAHREKLARLEKALARLRPSQLPRRQHDYRAAAASADIDYTVSTARTGGGTWRTIETEGSGLSPLDAFRKLREAEDAREAAAEAARGAAAGTTDEAESEAGAAAVRALTSAFDQQPSSIISAA